PAVREDQDADRARRLDEAGGGDRLARGGRMAEAVAAGGAGIGGDVLRFLDLALDELLVLVLVFLHDRLLLTVVPVAVLLGALVGRDQFGEHSRERVDLVAAELRPGREVRGP